MQPAADAGLVGNAFLSTATYGTSVRNWTALRIGARDAGEPGEAAMTAAI